MALNQNDRLAVFATVGEAFARTWELRIPVLVLAYLIALPWAVGSALGLFDSFKELAAVAAGGDHSQVWQHYPYGAMAIMLIGGLALSVVFAIFWFRYLLLGRPEALKFGLGQFNGMFWRMAGYSAVITLAALFIMFFAITLVALVGSALTILLGAAGGPQFVAIWAVLMLLAYPLPLAFLARFSLAFVGVALGRTASLGQSWSETRGTTWRLTGAIALAALPVAIPGYLISLAAFAALGIDMLDPQAALAAYDYWWLSWAISPTMVLPLALACAVAALAYRDLTGVGGATAPARDARFAH